MNRYFRRHWKEFMNLPGNEFWTPGCVRCERLGPWNPPFLCGECIQNPDGNRYFELQPVFRNPEGQRLERLGFHS